MGADSISVRAIRLCIYLLYMYGFGPLEPPLFSVHFGTCVLWDLESQWMQRIGDLFCQSTAGIAFSADLILRWVADGFWDFFQGVDAGSLSSTRHVQPLEAGIPDNLQSIIRVGM